MKVCTACSAEYGDEVLFCQRDGTPLRPSAATTDLVGQVVAERYHIQKKLGEGGMGQVYLAEHVKMGRRCAIKIMNPGLVTDPDAISRFNREAANASRIGHPNVCAIYDFGETPEGLIYLAMEFIEGRSLSALLDEARTLPLARAASIITQTADALQVAHDLGIVHRDLKPDNIMVTTGRGKDIVKVVDFGIAKAVGADSGSQKVTKTGFVVGTPEYMSPEQLAGDPIDGRSDLYSMALVFYRMLTGSSPFPADSQQETMIKRLTDEPLTLAAARPDVRFPAELQRVMDRALARTPEERYRTAGEFAKDVRSLAGSLTGAVDVEAGTQVVRTDALKGTGAVPATRVDPLAARDKPKAPGAPPSETGLSARGRGFPIVPAAVAVVVLASAGGLYAMRDALFGGGAIDTLTRRPPDTVLKPVDTSKIGGNTSDTGRRSGGNTGNNGSTGVRPKPDTTTDTGRRGGGVIPVRLITVPLPPPDSVFELGSRTAARRKATAIYSRKDVDDSTRAAAALVVSTAFQLDSNYADALSWAENSYKLHVRPQVAGLITQLKQKLEN